MASLPWLLASSTFLLFLLKFLFKQIFSTRTKPNLPPGPPKLPIIGNLHQLRDPNPHMCLRRLSNKFGPILYLKLGQVPTVVVSSAKMAEAVLKTHDLSLSSRPTIFSAKHLFYNCTDIAFAPYGAYWRHIRKLCILELLSAKRVQSFSFVREEEVARLISRVQESCSSTVDLSKMLGLYANDNLCRVALGRDFSHRGEYDCHGFQKMLEEYQELLGGFSIGDFFPSMEFIHSLTGLKPKLQDTFRRFDRLFDEIVNEHRIRRDHKRNQEHTKDLLDVLLDILENKSDGIHLTMDNVKAIMLDMFAAGTDTTFITLDWGMTELLMNPKVLETAQAEVRKVVGERRVVLETDLPRLEYMKAVIKETFRLHPPAPVLLPRESMEDVTVDGFDIPAKTRVFVNAWAIGRDPESWENPESFMPERFLHSAIDFKGQDFELIPFGAGRRSCPAVTFGTLSVELALAQLLHSFNWELPPGTEAKDLDLRENFGITMHRIEHLMVIAKPHFP
ncbi:Rhodanese/Cell cycle control phosphatase superfamily protein [Hibiscus syriacus]|uniref:Rhodanese/Cell cycle control phosphatase superfamily protein n=1 Tax=Hibiscus syriacus TaxID=106335 RepID=A0A6A3CXW7_HIBSY|nr:cytochrome P450 71AP13-like [Hibiscus syriacus]KAE8732198.1 Rhodanese/Cell cycle control phosphatase superfamily protein [Hibiscus syriacus]